MEMRLNSELFYDVLSKGPYTIENNNKSKKSFSAMLVFTLGCAFAIVRTRKENEDKLKSNSPFFVSY